jgi:undecaprenyl-diphosphatase
MWEGFVLDYQLFRLINDLAGQNPWLDRLFEGLTTFNPFLYLAVIVILALRASSRPGAIQAVAAASLAMGINFLIGLVYDRPRPFVTHHVHLLLPHTADASFPSDHTAGSIAIAVAIWCHNRKLGIPLFIVALLVGVSRIYVGHHYPTDVLGGIVVGCVSALLIYQWADKVSKKVVSRREEKSA